MNSYAWNSSLFTAFLPSARVMFTAPAPPTPTGTSASLFASSSYVVSTLEKKGFLIASETTTSAFHFPIKALELTFSF